MTAPAQPRRSAIVNNMLAGSVAGMTSLLVVQPMDVIRTRLQTSNRFKGPLQCAVETVRNEGPAALWKGMAAPLAAQGLYKAVMFGTYSTAQAAVLELRPEGKRVGALTIPELYACGAVAGGVNSLVVTPVELVRNLLIVQYQRVGGAASSAPAAASSTASATQQSAAAAASIPAAAPAAAQQTQARFSGPLDVARSVLRDRGVRGLWRGLSSTMSRDVPGVGAWYASFELAKRALVPAGQQPDASRLMAAGATAGVGFWLVALPMDTIKSVVQTDLAHKYRGFWDCGTQLVREQGFGRLYRGFSVAVTRGIPAASITFTVQGLVAGYLSKA